MCELTRSFTAADEPGRDAARRHRCPPVRAAAATGPAPARAGPRSLAAAGEDDVTTREYRHGDDLRRVHWRSTARRGELMVRREEQPLAEPGDAAARHPARSATAATAPASSFEWAVSAAASLAVHLAGRGYALRMVDGWSSDRTTGQPWSDGHAGLPATDAAGEVLDVLAAVAPGGSVDLNRAVATAGHGMAGGLVVAVLGRLGPGDSTLLTGVHQPGTHCLAMVAPGVASASDPSPAARPHGPHEVELDRLRAGGWEVVVAQDGERLDATWGRLGLHRELARGDRAGALGGGRR